MVRVAAEGKFVEHASSLVETCGARLFGFCFTGSDMPEAITARSSGVGATAHFENQQDDGGEDQRGDDEKDGHLCLRALL